MKAPSLAQSLPSSALEYDLPDELIARYPAGERDQSRLLVVDRTAGTWRHERFSDLVHLLDPGDAVLLNRTRVRRARTPGRRTTGGQVELLWLQGEGTEWRALARPAARLKPDELLLLEGGLHVSLVDREQDGFVRVRVPDGVDMEAWLEEHGHMPLPPYLGREDEFSDRERYQTVFSREPGAVAAPTAGLHFTQGTLADLKLRGIEVVDLLLHVGPGTFRPIQTGLVAEHRIDPEWYSISEQTWSRVASARTRGVRTVAVGTTVVRALETAARPEVLRPALEGWSDLLVTPPFEFKVVDALLTNFHLPRSSLLALVAAFAGLELTLNAYHAAVEERYRFYSYGDAMLIQ